MATSSKLPVWPLLLVNGVIRKSRHPAQSSKSMPLNRISLKTKGEEGKGLLFFVKLLTHSIAFVTIEVYRGISEELLIEGSN